MTVVDTILGPPKLFTEMIKEQRIYMLHGVIVKGVLTLVTSVLIMNTELEDSMTF